MIVCLGWGSLIWDPRDLPVENLAHRSQGKGFGNAWSNDGPCVKVEFARQSQDGRLTLVLYPKAKTVRSLWARMRVDSPSCAVEALRIREGTGKRFIGHWSNCERDPKDIRGLGSWASKRGVDPVIWTALGPKFCGLPGAPTETLAVAYLSSLSGCARFRAEEYVRRAPPQIDTLYRRRIECCLGWKSCELAPQVRSQRTLS